MSKHHFPRETLRRVPGLAVGLQRPRQKESPGLIISLGDAGRGEERRDKMRRMRGEIVEQNKRHGDERKS